MANEDFAPEKTAAIRKIRQLMDFWGIRPGELRGRPVPIPPSPGGTTTRYVHPLTGESWDGIGSQPQWLRRALLSEGYTVDELRAGARPTQVPDTGESLV